MAPEPPWPVTALYEADGRCLAGLQHALLRIAEDGGETTFAALRNVCVAPEARGRGLMRRLMEDVLARCGAATPLTLLYAAEPALYARFGFAAVAQHAFEGPAPDPDGVAGAAIPDEGVVRRLVGTRAPLSRRCDLAEDGGLRLSRLLHAGATVRHLPALDALALVEREGETLVLADLVASSVPSAARVIGALGERPARLRTLFPPDRLGWSGAPKIEDAGLMARGPLPAAMRRPFALPPTVEF